MIIKSMSRKVPSFDQLIAYMDLGASSRDNNIYHNLYSKKPDGIEAEFRENFRYVPKRKNGVTLYHEVISITRSKQIDEQEQIEVLRQIMYKYIQERAGDNVVYGVLHDDKADNLHYHLLISSNALESSKKHRLSKSEFESVKKNLELYVLECHPELEQQKLISKDKQSEQNGESLSKKGAELKRRTGKTPQRELVKEILLHIFASATTRQEFIELMESEGFQLYKRGKHWGILNEHTNRKHRFTTLGVMEAFEQLEKRLAENITADTLKQKISEESSEATDTKKRRASEDTKNRETSKPQQAQKSENNDVEDEFSKRKTQAQKMRNKKAQKKSQFKKQRWIRWVIYDSRQNTNRILNSRKFKNPYFNYHNNRAYVRTTK